MGKGKLYKFTVHLMTPYCTWEDVMAKNEADAVRKCDYPPEFDCNEPHKWIAVEDSSDE